MSYITTFTGKHVYPLEPTTDMIDILDIAHALSLIGRANGHFAHFYSVGQHSIACAKEAAMRGYSRQVQLACLLHDASEAYLSDVTRPIKHELQRYLEAEAVLQEMIYGKYIPQKLTEADRALVREIDDDMLSYEFHALMPEDLMGDRYRKVSCDMHMEFRRMDEVEEEFLQLFHSLKGVK